MTQPNSQSQVIPNNRLFIEPLKLTGPCQMALDMMLLEESIKAKNDQPMIRFYSWEGDWLSVGSHQKIFPERWKTLVRNQKLNLVRRPSGGGGVLHVGGLTYALVWPSPPKSRPKAYLKACEWLTKGFLKTGLVLQFGNKSPMREVENCFGTSSVADLVDQFGQKRVGSAQYWRFGQLLQHGEILLDPPKALWQEVFNEEPPSPAPSWVPRQGLDQILKKSFLTEWRGLEWKADQLSMEDWNQMNTKGERYEIRLPNSQE